MQPLGCALADWSNWSDWETCRCDSGQSRYRDCITGDDCIGMPGEERPCSCIPFDAQGFKVMDINIKIH